ncbi:MAG: NAD(P)-dependent oxidoreductase [Candidatus Hodarchaeales archaeon]
MNSNTIETKTNVRQTTVLFIWDVNEILKEYFKRNLEDITHIKLFFITPFLKDEMYRLAPEADIIIGWRPEKELLLSAKKLQLFINPGAGVQHLIELFKEINEIRPVLLSNGHGNSFFTAQHAIALLLNITNRIIQHHNWMLEGQWRKGEQDARSIPLRNRHIGLLGYGAVNQKVHKFLAGFDTDFSILRRSWDKQSQPLPTSAKKYEPSQLHEFLKEIDILIVAIPQTSKTINLIDEEELELLGNEGIVINVGRGTILNEKALFTCLKEKRIAFAGIDVWYDYRPEADSKGRKFPWHDNYPFQTLNNIILSPHRGASPMNDLQRWDINIRNIRTFALGQNNFVDIVDLDNEY